MKKLFVLLVVTGLWLGASSPASADYSVSIGYNSGDAGCGRPAYYPAYNHYPRHKKVFFWNSNRHFYRHQPVVIHKKTVVYSNDPRPAPESQEKLGISDIVVLAQAGVSDTVIIEKIRRTGSVFTLSAEEVGALRQEGVSAKVVNYMLNTKR